MVFVQRQSPPSGIFTTGVKDFYSHTNAQLAQIVTEFTQFKVGILQQAQEFRVAISNLTALEMNSFEVNYDLPI